MSILEQIEALREALDAKHNTVPSGLDFHEYEQYFEPERSRLNDLSMQYRKTKEPEFEELSDYGDVMTLEQFKEAVGFGGFKDSDGFGKYVRDGMESDIEIYPSDVEDGMEREDFDQIIWFNK